MLRQAIFVIVQSTVSQVTMKYCALLFALLLVAGHAFAQENSEPLNVYYGEVPAGEHTFFVAPDGDDAAAGTEEEPWATLNHAVAQVGLGDVIVLRGGVYYHDDTIRIQTPSGFTDQMIVVVTYPGEVPILDFSNQPKERNFHGIRLNANWWHLIGLTIRNASHNGIRMDGSFNILEQLTAYDNHDSGIHMAGSASNNLILNSDSFRNFNFDTARTPRIGNNADGFSAKFEIGPGNRYYGCRSWENSDDGFDFWEAEGTIRIENSWAFGNGDASVFGDPDNFEGNGNGFKLGGNDVVADHIVIRSMAFDNFGSSGNAKGFDYNNNRGAMTLVHNTAYHNGRNYYFPLDPPDGQAIYLNNLSVLPAGLHAQTPPGALLAGNSWPTGIPVTEDMFLSLDKELAKLPRQEDGSLPDIDLLKPAPGSFIVDGGVVLDEPFYGSAPDIGAREFVSGERTNPATPVGSGSVIADLVVFDMENASAWAVRSGLDEGTTIYGDDTATIVELPAEVMVDEWIQTATASRIKNFLLTTAQFTLAETRDVFIVHADGIEEKPQWLDAFTETDIRMTVTAEDGGSHEMTLYQREVEAGDTITLGRNSTDATVAAPMYVVIAGARLYTGIDQGEAPEAGFLLADVFPNPVVDHANVTYTLERGAAVTVKIYDMLGREIAVIAEGYRAAESHAVTWDADNASSGVYYVRLSTGGMTAVKQLVRMR